MVAIAATFVFAWLVAPASVPLAVLLIAATWVLNLYIVSKRVRSLPKRSVAALVALSFTACLDSPGYQPEVAGEDEGDPTTLREVAYATAKALTASEVRLDVLAAMRASVRVEHALILGEYLGTPDGVRLLRGAAHAVGVTENEFHRRVLTLPALELVGPIRDHRLGWTGSAHIGVAGSLDSDATEFTIYEASGVRRHAVNIPRLREYDAFFHIRPQEGFGTRIGRQADVPGPVIQDPDDGEQAVIVTVTMDDGESRSVDYGQFRDESERRLALADLFGGAVGGSGDGTTADAGSDDDCDYLADGVYGGGLGCSGGGGGGGGGVGLPTWSENPTYLEEWRGLCKVIGGDGPGKSEVEVHLWFHPRPGNTQLGIVRTEGVTCDHEREWEKRKWDYPGEYLLGASKIRGGVVFYIKVIETDLFFDDLLVEGEVEPEHNGRYMEWTDTLGDPEFKVLLNWWW